MRRFFLALLLFFKVIFGCAQDITGFSQFFFNPYVLNSSYAGVDNRTVVYAAYRKQWVSQPVSPSVVSFSAHFPLDDRFNLGFNFANDQRSLLNASGLMATGAYKLTLKENSQLRFGLSLGYSGSIVNYSGVTGIAFDNSDPVLGSAGSHSGIIGNAGISFHSKTFHAGVSLPNVFHRLYVSRDANSVRAVDPLHSVIVHASNRFYFDGDRSIFEPYAIYRLDDVSSQYEIAGVLHMRELVWIGGSFKQNAGASAMAGIHFQNRFSAGLSYMFINAAPLPQGAPSFEIQMGYLLGKIDKGESPGYSFLYNDRLTKRKSASEVSRERKKKQRNLEKHLEGEKAKHKSPKQK